MNSEYAQMLLSDANAVIGFAVRAGISLDESLLHSRDAVSSGDVSQLSSLEMGLASAVRAIHPVTIPQLRSSRNPLSSDGASARGMVTPRRLLLLIAAILVISIISVTSLVHRHETALQAIKEASAADFDGKFRELVRAVYDGRLNESNPAEIDAFRLSVLELLKSDSQRAVATDLADAVSRPLVDPISKALSDLVNSLIEALRQSDSSIIQNASFEGKALPDSNSYFGSGKAAPDPCMQPQGSLSAAQYRWVYNIADMKARDACLATRLGVYPAYISFARFEYRTSDSIKLYYSWILPLLYGSLGAVVFLMRNTHNVRTPFLDSSDTLFRIAVGAIAGIVVGWFFSPDSGSSVREMSVAPLGVAFLAGFSIEALFGLLDRAVNAIHGQAGAT